MEERGRVNVERVCNCHDVFPGGSDATAFPMPNRDTASTYGLAHAVQRQPLKTPERLELRWIKFPTISLHYGCKYIPC